MKRWIDTDVIQVTDSEGDPVRVPDLGGVEQDLDVHYSMLDRGDGTCLCRVTTTESKMGTVTGAAAVSVFDDSQARAAITDYNAGSGLENLDQPDLEVDQILNNHQITDLLSQHEQDKVTVLLQLRREVANNPEEGFNVRRLLQERGVRSIEELVEISTSQDLRVNIVEEFDLTPVDQIGINAATAARAAVQLPSVGGQVLQDQEVTALNKAAKAEGRNRADELPENTKSDNDGDMSQRSENLLGGMQSDHDDMLEYIKGNSPPPWSEDENPPGKGQPQNP